MKSFFNPLTGSAIIILLIGSVSWQSANSISGNEPPTSISSTLASDPKLSDPKLKGIPLSCYLEVGTFFNPQHDSLLGSGAARQQIQEDFLSRTAIAYAEADQLERSLEIVGEIKNPIWFDATLVAAIARYAALGQYNRARELVGRLKNQDRHYFKVQALTSIAREFAEAGNSQQAEIFFARAVEVSRSLDKQWQALNLTIVAIAFAAVGEFDSAKQLAETISDRDRHAEAFAEIAQEYAVVGEFDSALQLAASITRQDYKIETIVAIASRLAEAGEFDNALELARSLRGNEGKAVAFAAIALHANLDQLDQLLPLATSTNQKIALATIAGQYLKKDKFDLATELTAILETAKGSEAEIVNLARQYAEAGRLRKALELADSIGNSYWKFVAFMNVAIERVAMGEHPQGIEIANRISVVENRIEALEAIATQYAESGQYDLALDVARNIQPDDFAGVVAAQKLGLDKSWD